MADNGIIDADISQSEDLPPAPRSAIQADENRLPPRWRWLAAMWGALAAIGVALGLLPAIPPLIVIIVATFKGKLRGNSWAWAVGGFAVCFFLSGALLLVAIANLLWTIFQYIAFAVGLWPQ